MARTNYYEAPMNGPIAENGILASLPAEYIPAMLSALETRKNRVFWKTEDDYTNGLQGILAAQWGLLMNTGEQIVQSIDRLYRLLDTTFNGTQYAAVEGAITPPIPPAPPASTSEGNAMRAHVGRLWALAENAATGATFSPGAGIEGAPALPASLSWAARLLSVQGVTDAGWFAPDQPVTLKRLLEASRINSNTDKTVIRNATTTLADTVTAGGSIADAIGDFLTAAADAGTDGGVIAVQLATSAALLLQLQRINFALNGNPVVSAGTPSLLFALRGDNVITTDNNVLSQLTSGLHYGDPQKTIHEVLYELINDSGKPPLAALLENIDLQTEQLYNVAAAVRQLAGLEAAGQIVQGSALRLTLDLLECICIGVSGTPAEPPPVENPPPAACLDNSSSYIRNAGWYKVPNSLELVNGVECEAWIPVFDGFNLLNVAQATTQAGSPTILIQNAQTQARRVCFGWNFSDVDIYPRAASRYIAGVESGASPPFDAEVPPGLAVPTGFRGDDITASSAGPYGTLYSTLILFFPAGDTTPSNNAFVGVEELVF